MRDPRILVVDDEKNIRITLSQALVSIPAEVETASDGKEALQKVADGVFSLILLDLRMPEMGGMEVLQKLRDDRPEIPVAIITAHGNVESAVDAMKLGAIEFIQKPFGPDEIRGLVRKILERHQLEESEATDYGGRYELAKRCISERHFDAAGQHLKAAIGLDPERPEAFNLLGVVHELRGEHTEAMKNYRVAYHLDASYKPADANLSRAGSFEHKGKPITIGDLRETKKPADS